MKLKKQLFKTKLVLFLTGLLIIISLTGCSTVNKSTTTINMIDSDGKNIGEGSIAFTFEVIDANKTITKFEVYTDEKTVGAALLKVGLIEGDESEYGLYINVVNGIKVDYNTDKAYWSLCIDGEYAMSGVDFTDIEEDKTYAFVYTKE